MFLIKHKNVGKCYLIIANTLLQQKLVKTSIIKIDYTAKKITLLLQNQIRIWITTYKQKANSDYRNVRVRAGFRLARHYCTIELRK